MVALLLIISALVILVDQIIHRNICSPITVFCGLWAVIAFLASLRLFGFTGFDEDAVKLIVYGLLGFSAGCLLVEACFPVQSTTNMGSGAFARVDEPPFRMKLLYVILLLVCIGQIISLFTALLSFSQGATLSDVRGARMGYSDDQFFSNPIISAFVNYFCGPALSMLLPVAIVLWFIGLHRSFCAIVLLCTVSGVVSSGGRISLVYLAIQLVAAMIYFQIRISKKVKRRILIVVAVGAIAVVGLTIIRSSASFLESSYSYFAIPVGLLSTYTKYVDISGFESFGGAFLYPIFYVANVFANVLGAGVNYLSDLVYYVALPQNTWVGGLFPGRSYNAFASLFYYFYLDFREPGVIGLSLIYGLMMSVAYRKAFVERSAIAMVWYLLALQSMFGSFIIWQLGGTKFFVSMLLLVVAQKRTKSDMRLRAKHRSLESSIYRRMSGFVR